MDLFTILLDSKEHEIVNFAVPVSFKVTYTSGETLYYMCVTRLSWEFVDDEHTETVLYLGALNGTVHIVGPKRNCVTVTPEI